MIKAGERIAVRPVTLPTSEEKGGKTMTGTVVYVHPKRRFCVLAFSVGSGTIREDFQMVEGAILE